MVIDNRSRALSAAVRLALGATLASGCGGTVAREPGHEGEGGEPANALGAVAPSDPSPAPTPHPLEGCKEKLRAAFGDDAGAQFWEREDALRTEPELVACCNAIVASTDGATTERFRNAGCCKVDVPDNGSHCTPWGPPMPPPFVREGDRRGIA